MTGTSVQDLSDLTNIINSIITPHDVAQDGALLFFGLCFVVIAGWAYLHARDHRNGKWMIDPNWKDRQSQQTQQQQPRRKR